MNPKARKPKLTPNDAVRLLRSPAVPEPKPVPTVAPAQNIMERAVCLSVTLNRMGTGRRVSADRMQVRDAVQAEQPDKEMVKVGKLLLESDALDAIRTLDNKVRRYIYSRALPADFFRSGVYLLPVALLADVDEELTQYATQREALVAAFLAEYPRICAAAQDRLRALYNPSEYPDVRDVAGMFSFTWRYVTFETPGSISKVSRALFEREAKKLEAELAGAADAVRQALREAMGEVVQEMVAKMTDQAEGKPKVFRGSSISRVQDFLDTFKARNLTDDGDLQKLVDQAHQLVKGITPDALREDTGLRAEIKQGFEAIKEAITPMLTAKPSRAVSFRDE